MTRCSDSADASTADSSASPARQAVTVISPFIVAAWAVMLLLLTLVLTAHLLTSLLAGLLVYHLVHRLTPLIEHRLPHQRAVIVVLLLSLLVIAGLSFAILATVAFFRDPDRLLLIQAKLVLVIAHAHQQLPDWSLQYLPTDVSDLRDLASDWLQAHSGTVQLVGKEAAQVFIHLLIGMVLGAMAALQATLPTPVLQPLSKALLGRCALLADAFSRIVFAQIKISALNTLFTAIFLLLILRLAHVHLPLTKTMILLTFIVGLLPVIGNLISNTLIVIIALSVSLYVAIAALIFLIVIHKFEYFLNARIVGSQINARSWELLLAMLLAEALFGLPGLVAAPIYYAYIKRELYQMAWV